MCFIENTFMLLIVYMAANIHCHKYSLYADPVMAMRSCAICRLMAISSAASSSVGTWLDDN